MKIVIQENERFTEPEVIINCRRTDETILKLLASLRAAENILSGMKNGQTFLLSPNDVLYVESVDKKTFIYTCTEVYETPLKLYEFEEKLCGGAFFRASKSTVINLSGVLSLRPDFGGRLLLTMNNGEKIAVSRQYAGAVKQKLLNENGSSK